MPLRRHLLALFLPWLVAAAPEPVDEAKAIVAERDQLIEKIVRGDDFEKSVARFGELKKRFESLSAAKQLSAARDAASSTKAREKWNLYLRSLDYRVGDQCAMSVDPKNRRKAHGYELFRAEYGKIIAKKIVKIPAKTGFDEDESVETYQVGAQTGALSFGAKEMRTHDGKPFSGSVGDWVFLCFASVSSHGSGSYLPPEFRDKVVGSGFASRIKSPPKIASKAKWNPLHLVGLSTLRSVAQTGRWPIEENVPILSHLIVEKDLGNGRFEIRLDQASTMGRPSQQTFLLDVPSGLRYRDTLGPGEAFWAIMSNPVIDKQLRKLILTAEDLEPFYVEGLDDPK